MHKKSLFAICCFALFSFGAYATALQSLARAIGSYFHTHEALLGVIIAVHFAGMIASMVVFGELSERIGKRAILLISTPLVVIGGVLGALSGNIVVALIGIFLIGCGYSSAEGVLTALVVDLFDGRTAFVVNSVQVCFCLGALISPVAAQGLMEIGWRWQTVFIAPTLLYIPVFFALLKAPKLPPAPLEGGLVSLKLLQRPIIPLSMLLIGLYVGIEAVTAVWGLSYMLSQGATSAQAALCITLLWGFMVPGRLLAGLRKSAPGKVLMQHIFISIAGVALILALPAAYKLVGFAVTGLGFSAIWTSVFGVIDSASRDYSGTAFSMLGLAGCSGGMLVPAAIGAFTVRSEVLPMIIVAAILLLLVALMGVIKRVSRTQRGIDEA